MNIELGVLLDGGVMLVCDKPLPDLVCRVEYYREQRLFMLVYHSDNDNGELMHYEVPSPLTRAVESSPNVIIYSLFPNHEPIGYKVPLIQIGHA